MPPLQESLSKLPDFLLGLSHRSLWLQRVLRMRPERAAGSQGTLPHHAG